MKFLKSAALVAALFLGLAGAAMATTWQAVQSGNYRVSRAVTDSSTTPTGQNSASPANKDVVYLSSTTPVSTDIVQTLQDGTVLAKQNVAVSGATPVVVSFSAPQPHQKIVISPTTSLSGTNTLHAVFVESR